jgi:hypothetical protein
LPLHAAAPTRRPASADDRMRFWMLFDMGGPSEGRLRGAT